MIPIASLILASGDATLAAVAKSFINLKSASAFVQDATTAFMPIKVTFSPAGGRMWMPNNIQMEVSKSETRFYDELFNQVAKAPTKNTAHPERELISSSITHRSAMGFLIDSDLRRQFMQDLQKNKGWQLSGNKLILDQKPKGRTEVTYDGEKRITSVKVISGKIKSIDFRFQYVDTAKVPVIPTTAKPRDGLTARPELPPNTPPDTLMLCRRIWTAMSRLDGSTVQQKSDRANFTTRYEGGGLVESGAKQGWSYQSGTLKIGGAGQKMGPAQAIDALSKKGIDVSSLSRYVLNKQVPFLEFFNRPIKVWEGGKITTDGRPYTILNIDRAGTRIRLFVHQKTNRIEILSAESVDSKGTRLTTSRMRLSYN